MKVGPVVPRTIADRDVDEAISYYLAFRMSSSIGKATSISTHGGFYMDSGIAVNVGYRLAPIVPKMVRDELSLQQRVLNVSLNITSCR